MEKLILEGGKRLSGEIEVHGAKNSALPILAASLLYGGVTELHNCPNLSDVDAAVEILKYLGCKIEREKDVLVIDSTTMTEHEIPETLMHEMRSSIVFLGAVLSRMSKALLTFPGGCELGLRPIDLHILSLKQLGVEITEEYGKIDCKVLGKLKGTKISLPFPSVGATENIILASVLSEGETIIQNAAQEPEIIDLANYLISRGAKIKDAGKSRVVIEGVKKLGNTKYTVMSDRIVGITYMVSAAITGGNVTVKNVNPADIESVIPILEETGVTIKQYNNEFTVVGKEIIKPVKIIRTMPFPGFPTDAQALLVSLLVLANGTSVIVENIFESRYKYVNELCKMGADVRIEGRVAIIHGVEKLYGSVVSATDLRGGAAMCLAGLAAKGTTTIENIAHIDRGYENIETNLKLLGAEIKRIKDETK